MSETKRHPVPLFATAFDLCAAVLESGEIDPETALGNARRFGPVVLGDIALPPGSFAVLVNSDNEFLCWAKECERTSEDEGAPVAVFEPFHGPMQPGEIYLVGEYDNYHRWLTRARVCRIGAILEGKVIYRDDDGKLDLDLDATDEIEDLLVVGRLVAVKPSIRRPRPAAAVRAKSKADREPVTKGDECRVKTQGAGSDKIVPISCLRQAA